MVKYKQHTPEFKMQVALEAAKGLEGVNDIAGRHGIHSKQVTEWKKRLLEGAETIFEKKPREEELANKRDAELLKKVGELSMEIDWLKKKLKQ
jgi:transposase-like protein